MDWWWWWRQMILYYDSTQPHEWVHQHKTPTLYAVNNISYTLQYNKVVHLLCGEERDTTRLFVVWSTEYYFYCRIKHHTLTLKFACCVRGGGTRVCDAMMMSIRLCSPCKTSHQLKRRRSSRKDHIESREKATFDLDQYTTTQRTHT